MAVAGAVGDHFLTEDPDIGIDARESDLEAALGGVFAPVVQSGGFDTHDADRLLLATSQGWQQRRRGQSHAGFKDISA